MTLTFCIMCGSLLQGQTQSGVETGIEGVITISPTKAGPIRADAPSSLPLANATFVVENQKSEVASFTTDGQGRFRMPLAPGRRQSAAHSARAASSARRCASYGRGCDGVVRRRGSRAACQVAVSPVSQFFTQPRRPSVR